MSGISSCIDAIPVVFFMRNVCFIVCCTTTAVSTGYDSDVEREKKIDYSTKIYASSVQEKEGVKPHLQQMEEEDK